MVRVLHLQIWYMQPELDAIAGMSVRFVVMSDRWSTSLPSKVIPQSLCGPGLVCASVSIWWVWIHSKIATCADSALFFITSSSHVTLYVHCTNARDTFQCDQFVSALSQTRSNTRAREVGGNKAISAASYGLVPRHCCNGSQPPFLTAQFRWWYDLKSLSRTGRW